MSVWRQPAIGDAWLVGISGRLDQTQTPELETELLRMLDQGYYRLIVDLSEVTYVNSGGLRCLVTVWREARNHGGDVLLCGLSPRVMRIFRIVGFDKVFQIFSTCDAAQKTLEEM